MLDSLLRDELARRRTRNPRYSLRALARDAGLHHGTLSQVMRGRRRLGAAQIHALGRRLGIARTKLIACCLAEIDAAVRAAVSRPGFRHDSRWIATRTGIPVDDVNAALHRLLRAGALQMVAATNWRTRA